jgi:hypothetical protein
MAISVANHNVMNLTRSLEKILDECSASGELKLANRKLKDFPKYYGKFNLTDTVFAGEFKRPRSSALLCETNLSHNLAVEHAFLVYEHKNFH